MTMSLYFLFLSIYLQIGQGEFSKLQALAGMRLLSWDATTVFDNKMERFYLLGRSNHSESHFHRPQHSMISQERIVATFLELVQIDGASGNELAVARYLQDRLDHLNISNEQDDAGQSFGGNAGNVIGRVKGSVEATPILVCSHMDTVGETRGVKPVFRDGQIETDETTILGADDRAGIAAILEVLTVVRERDIPHGPIEVVFTVGEETGMHGSKYLKKSDLAAKLGFVFDSSAIPGHFVVEAPSSVAFRIQVLGRAAHAAVSPEKGINAISIASRAIAMLKLGRVGDVGMLNVGTIRGGRAINIVPDKVEIEGETRSNDERELQSQLDLVREQFESAAKDSGGHVEIESWRKYSGFRLTESDPVVSSVMEGIASAGFEPKPLRYPGGSDANIFNEKRIPTVNLGMGYQNVHSFQESISVNNLVAAATIGLHIVKHLSQVDGEVMQ